MKNRIFIAFAAILLMGSTFMFVGCSKDNSITEETKMEAMATDDAALAIAASVSGDNGGAIDQMNDVLMIATPAGLQNESNEVITSYGSGRKTVVKDYDSLNGWWTVTVTKKRGTPGGLYYADYTRVYKHQYLNKNGVFQKSYIVGADTAYTIKHEIVSGSGITKTPKAANHLNSLSGKWIVTKANESSVVFNTVTGFPFSRSVSDTIIKLESQRTLNAQLMLNFTDVTGPRGSGLNWHRKTNGTITGTYHAVVTFQRGTTYREKIIDRNISITLGSGTGKARLELGGKKFDLDLMTGDLD